MTSFILQELPAHSRHMGLGIVMYQEEPTSHCTSIMSETRSKDFVMVPNDSQGVIAQPVEVCASVYGYVSLDLH